jgi:hypothetical protein
MQGALVTRLSGLRATLQRSRLSDPGREVARRAPVTDALHLIGNDVR